MEYKIHLLEGKVDTLLGAVVSIEPPKEDLEDIMNVYASEGYSYEGNIPLRNEKEVFSYYLIFKK